MDTVTIIAFILGFITGLLFTIIGGLTAYYYIIFENRKKTLDNGANFSTH